MGKHWTLVIDNVAVERGAYPMAQVAFGLFDWIDRGTAPLHQLYEERLHLLEAADADGFFCYHLAEHHATPLGMAPSPALFLTAAAQRTQHIHLGPLVYLLPLYHPLRLIEGNCSTPVMKSLDVFPVSP